MIVKRKQTTFNVFLLIDYIWIVHLKCNGTPKNKIDFLEIAKCN